MSSFTIRATRRRSAAEARGSSQLVRRARASGGARKRGAGQTVGCVAGWCVDSRKAASGDDRRGEWSDIMPLVRRARGVVRSGGHT
jgi:hypothetical protein